MIEDVFVFFIPYVCSFFLNIFIILFYIKYFYRFI